MGHRHFFNTSSVFDSEHDQNWNHMHAEQPYIHMVRATNAENDSLFYPVENMSVDGLHFTSPWNHAAPRSNGHASSSLNGEVAHYQADASGQSRDPMLHPSAAGTFPPVSDNYAHHGSSSAYDRQSFHAIEGSYVDLTMGNGRGLHKRKSPGIPTVSDRGSSSRYYNAGSSSDLAVSSEQQEKPTLESQQLSWECITANPHYRSNSLLIRGEGSARNVRSRSTFDLESNLARTHLSSTPPINSYSTSHPIEHSNSIDLSGQNSAALGLDWNQISMNPAHGRISVSDASGFSHETNHFLVGSSNDNASLEIGGGYHHDFISGRNTVVPPGFHGMSTQSSRGVRSSYSQRSSPAFRASSSTLRLGPVAPSDEGLQLLGENYSSRHPRPLSSIGWRSNDRSGRSRISNERHRLLSDEAAVHDRLASEGFMIVERSTLHGSRNMLDQHREMRLDVDDMSYEELLALGERIGSVSTGLSEDLISKSLTETIYCSSDQMQEEGHCVICLEDYNNMDDVGALKTCGHDFHVSCIKKWLSMKNVCPICKASAQSDNLPDK